MQCLPRGGIVLVTAPSSAAADVICDRLRIVGLSPKEMLRLNWYHRKVESVLLQLLGYCSQDKETGAFVVPPVSQLREFRVIVCTCMSAVLLTAAGLEPDHFTHLFIDEASQALLPESLMPLAAVASDACVVMAGDPFQLGAAIRSPVSARLDLGVSWQERLMALPIYSSEDARLIVKLRHNYRSHACILELPSQLYYNKELLQSADPRVVDSLCDWDQLRPDGSAR